MTSKYWHSFFSHLDTVTFFKVAQSNHLNNILWDISDFNESLPSDFLYLYLKEGHHPNSPIPNKIFTNLKVFLLPQRYRRSHHSLMLKSVSLRFTTSFQFCEILDEFVVLARKKIEINVILQFHWAGSCAVH